MNNVLDRDLPRDRDHPTEDGGLARGLSNRHIQLISIGGAIGTGLFMGAGKTISISGTSIILTYMVIGFFLFFVMRAMGEMLLSNLRYKSFADFCSAYLGPWAGFFIGWSYWLTWVVGSIADYVVVGGYMQFWFPTLPAWIPAIATLTSLLLLNMLTVKLFGELEFWFALVKIVAILTLIAVGIYLVSTSFVSPAGVRASLSHLVEKDAFMPHGVLGFFAGFQIAIFSFAGIELVGTTAAETKDPERNLPRAINAVPLRVIIFYVLSLACIISVSSWKNISAHVSPFVQLFLAAGFPMVAAVINFVVTTSAMSAANSGVFSTSRMLYGLASTKDAPALFRWLTSRSVPVMGLLFSCLCMLIGILLLFVIPDVMSIFTIVSTVSAILFIFVWSLILVAYLVYRMRNPDLHAKSRFKMPGGIPMASLCLAFFVFVVGLLTLDADTRSALRVMPLWFFLLLVAYKLTRRGHRRSISVLEHAQAAE
ncbi:amino acid permease [Paraburkholderia fungorum]|uniref:amino acid permease n=1 Tax=Paraburkholderia fungorum TaxID=134537 RepID=UPI0020982DC7|nr:amino acid permease [Paraburkholderia fungorum]USX06750.1 amino acid permease [Paraburkholderia fungorum]